MSEEVKYPNITVKLIGEDGNAFAIIGQTCKALREAGLSEEQWHEYREEAMSGDYNHVLQTTMKYVNVR